LAPDSRKIIAAEFAIMNNFLWNDRWTFADIAIAAGMASALEAVVEISFA